MEYQLLDASNSDIKKLIDYKLNTTIQDFMDEEEKIKIKNYVKSHIPNQISSYKVIVINNIVVGCLRIIGYEDGVLVDEIFIEKEFRNKGIGRSILSKIIKDNNEVYLWVYSTNIIAKSLYQKLGFKTILKNGLREFMQYKL